MSSVTIAPFVLPSLAHEAGDQSLGKARRHVRIERLDARMALSATTVASAGCRNCGGESRDTPPM